MIKNFVCVFLIVTIATIVFAGPGKEDDILSRCKHVQCKNVADLQLEVRIRRCVKTMCMSRALKNFKAQCQEDCKDEVGKSGLENISGKPAKIIDFDWLN